MANSIAKSLVTMLQEVLSASTLFSEVSTYPKSTFNAYPSAFLYWSGMVGDYETTRENKRIYQIRAVIVNDAAQTTLDNSWRVVYEGAYNLEKIIDEDDQLTAATTTLPTGAMLLGIRPVSVGTIIDEEQKRTAVEVELNCYVEVEFKTS